jgi:hypothetical protein
MREDLEAVGIGPSQELFQVMSQAGYEMPAPAIQPSSHKIGMTEGSSGVSSLMESIEAYQEGSMSKESLDKVLSDVRQKGYETKGMFIDAYESAGKLPSHAYGMT